MDSYYSGARLCVSRAIGRPQLSRARTFLMTSSFSATGICVMPTGEGACLLGQSSSDYIAGTFEFEYPTSTGDTSGLLPEAAAWLAIAFAVGIAAGPWIASSCPRQYRPRSWIGERAVGDERRLIRPGSGWKRKRSGSGWPGRSC
jgi:hypothetical protein